MFTVYPLYKSTLLFHRSDLTFYETSSLKKVCFNNLNDIKVKIETDNIFEAKPVTPNCIDLKLNLRSSKNEFHYGNTVIKKVEPVHEDGNIKPVPVLEFLKNIKEEPDDDSFDEVSIFFL